MCRNSLLDRKSRSVVCPMEWLWKEAEPKESDHKWGFLLTENDPRGLFNLWSVMPFLRLTCFSSEFCFHELLMQRATWVRTDWSSMFRKITTQVQCVNLLTGAAMRDSFFSCKRSTQLSACTARVKYHLDLQKQFQNVHSFPSTLPQVTGCVGGHCDTAFREIQARLFSQQTFLEGLSKV